MVRKCKNVCKFDARFNMFMNSRALTVQVDVDPGVDLYRLLELDQFFNPTNWTLSFCIALFQSQNIKIY